jgi:hypothetical protein
MIRRQPTAIKLTPEDVLNYDDEKLRQQQSQYKAAAGNNNSFNQNTSASSQGSVLQERQSLKSRDERIGVRPTNR